MTAASAYLMLPEGVFLVVGMLIVLESPLGSGLVEGRERILGTLMGLLGVVISSGAFRSATQPMQIFIGLILVRLFSFSIGLSSGYVVGGHMVAGSLLNEGSQWWHYAFWRTIMTVGGVLIGVYFSRVFYPQRSTSPWQRRCQSWLYELSSSLSKLATSREPISRFQSLREERNKLRLELPKLIAEQVYLDRKDGRILIQAQSFLQHGSAILSCTMDLSMLMRSHSIDPWARNLPIGRLVQSGCRLLQQIADDRDSHSTISEILDIRKTIETDVDGHLQLKMLDVHSEDSLLLASRLLLLANSLIDIAAPKS